MTEHIAIQIGQSYIDKHGGDVVEAVKHNAGSAADILIAHIAQTDPALAARLDDALAF